MSIKLKQLLDEMYQAGRESDRTCNLQEDMEKQQEIFQRIEKLVTTKDPTKPCGHFDCSVSSSICETTTHGRGKLDENGYWEIPCYVCARAAEDRDGHRTNHNWPWSSGCMTALELSQVLSTMAPEAQCIVPMGHQQIPIERPEYGDFNQRTVHLI